MKIFRDIFTGNELLSDTHRIDLVDEVVYRVVAEMITVNCDVDDRMIGGNQSAEAETEQLDSTSRREFNLVESHRLEKADFFTDKKNFTTHVKLFMGRVVAKLAADGMPDEELSDIKLRLGKFVKKEMVDKFKDWEFYVGENEGFDGLIVAMRWEEDETIPVFYYFKHALIEEKV